MRVGLVILPSDRWDGARRQWEWADDVGFATGWTYDHIRWSGMPEGPWHAAVPVLAAAAGVTRRLRLGTLVATPNFRHPVTLGRDAIALDDVSGGRLDLGLGSGSEGPDAAVLGQEPWPPAERMARFAEFLGILSAMLTADGATSTSLRTEHYAAVEAPSTPGTLQHPLPLTVAASATTGLHLAATYGHQWVTIGPGRGPRTPETILEAVRHQVEVMDVATRDAGRDRPDRVLLWTPVDPVITSVDQFDTLTAPYAELGFDQFVLHHPAQTGPYSGNVKAFEQIAAKYAGGGR
jgi:alkanesulfonate monooxygenase SsuD/methylene tetrahydromethanopterin reductase-like flavin-dependent oxidoreductase (luciferase family)